MYDFRNDYIKQIWRNMDTGSFIVYIKADDNYKDIAEDVETRFDTSNYEK